MAHQKPLMTPEQQTMFKQAVAQKALDPVPYDQYCAITPEQADAKFKELEGKVDFGKPLPEKNKAPEAPRQKLAPDAPATDAQRKAIIKGIEQGHLEDYPPEWEKLTVGKASEYVKMIHDKMPPELATEGQKKEIDRLVKTGRLYPMKSETYHSQTKSDASDKIAIGQYNEKQGITVEGFDPNYVRQRDQKMSPEQAAEIDALVAEGRLNPLSDKQKAEYTQEQAGKLIYVGNKRREENTLAPEYGHGQSQEQEAPEKEPEKVPEKEPEKKSKGKSPKKPKSPADDIPM